MKNFLSYRNIKWMCLAALVLLLIPMLWLGFFAAPAADDFSFGAPAHRAFVESGSVPAAVAAAAGKVVESYFGWQGTFSAIFLMAIQPAVFSEGLYWLTTFIMLSSLMVGTFLFCRALFGEVLGLDRQLCDIAAVMLLLLSTQLLPSPVQGFYWFNGAVYYVFFHGLMLTALALGVAFHKRGGGWRRWLLCLLAIVLGGGNYVTALICAVLWFFAEAFLYYRKKEWKKFMLPGFLLLLAFAVNMAAPGNAVRQAAQPESCGVLEAVLLSFKNGISYSLDWLELPVLGAMAFVCILAVPALRDCGFRFGCPGLVSLISYCIISAMFCPPVYAMGNVGELRLVNIIYFTWLLALAVNLIYWLGWLLSRRAAKKSGLEFSAFALAFALLLTGFALPALSGRAYTSTLALGTICSGEAKAYHDAALRRFELLNDESISAARIEPYPSQPYLLFYSDIVDDPEDWDNIDMASFYGKDSVSFNTLP